MTYKLATTQPVRYLTVREAAERVERSRRQVETWIHDGLPVFRFGDRIRYVREDHLLHELRRRELTNPAHHREPGIGVRRARRVIAILARKHG